MIGWSTNAVVRILFQRALLNRRISRCCRLGHQSRIDKATGRREVICTPNTLLVGIKRCRNVAKLRHPEIDGVVRPALLRIVPFAGLQTSVIAFHLTHLIELAHVVSD